MNEFLNVQLLERAGLAGVALASIWANYRLVTSFNKTMQNHMIHQAEATTKLNNAVDKLITFLQKKLK